MLNLEAPAGLFGTTTSSNTYNNTEQIGSRDVSEDSTSKTSKSIGSKFSLNSFGSKFKKNASISFDSSISKKNEERETNKTTSLKVSEYRKVKIPYTYDINRGVPFLDESKKRRINWNDIINRQKTSESVIQAEQREIEKKVAEEDVLDFFGSGEKVVVEIKDESNTFSSKINDVISSLDITEVITEKGKSSSGNKVSIEGLFDILYRTFEYMSSEERGRVILNIIFGCLISRSKFLGTGGRIGSSGFKDIISSLSKLKRGGSGEVGSKIYIAVLDLLSSNKLSSYRSNITAANQVQNVASFINRIAKSNLEIYFPSNISFTDPVSVYVTESGKQVLNTKSIPLVGTPTLENLNNFFSSQTVQSKPKSQKKKINGDFEDDYLDQEDNMLNKGYKGRDDR